MTTPRKNPGRHARQKGKRGERETATEIREVFPEIADEIRRGWQTRKGDDESDIVGLPGWHVEVKTGKMPNPRAALAQAERDAKHGNTPVAVIRDDRKRPFAVLRWDDLLRLIGIQLRLLLKGSDDERNQVRVRQQHGKNVGGNGRERRISNQGPSTSGREVQTAIRRIVRARSKRGSSGVSTERE